MSCKKKQALKEKDMKEKTLNVKDIEPLFRKRTSRKKYARNTFVTRLWKIRKGLRIIKNESIITNVDKIGGQKCHAKRNRH